MVYDGKSIIEFLSSWQQPFIEKTRMKIGISTRGLEQGSYAISTIVLQLTRTLIELGSSRHDIFLYGNNPRVKELFPPEIPTHLKKINNRFIWDQIWLPQALKKDGIDIALFMKGTMPVFLPARGAVIIHDLGYFHSQIRPYRFLETQYMKFMMKKAALKADVIFTVSEFTRTEMIEIFHLNPAEINVCYEDVSPLYRPVSERSKKEEVQARYNLPEHFAICPISISPRKNLSRILKAFKKIENEIPCDLVLTGGQYGGIKDLFHRAISNSNQRVHVLGHVEPESMPVLYSLADFALYPSLLEGFGMPVLEAFRCGCPILTSNVTSLPEVAGDAAYLGEPYNLDQIADGMLKLATDASLRETLIHKGYKRAQNFSWERTARIILEKLEA